jgi:hypothetical protein
MSLDMLHLATCGKTLSAHSVEERFPFANAVPKMKPSQIIFSLPSLQQNSTLRTDADHVQHISIKNCKLLEYSLLWNLMKIMKHVWKNQHQNDATYNKSCTLSELVCLEILLFLIANYKHFNPFYRKADFDKLLDSCITM